MPSPLSCSRLSRCLPRTSASAAAGPRRRGLASASSSATFLTAPPVRVVSRSALARHSLDRPALVRALPSPPKIKDSSDTPWPLPLRVAGYVVVALSVPYCAAQAVAASPGLRDGLEGDRPDLETDSALGKGIVALVRRYWGEPAEPGLPYHDRVRVEEEAHLGTNPEGEEEGPEEEWLALEAEPSRDLLLAQAEVQRLRHRPVRVRATLVQADQAGGRGWSFDGAEDVTAWRGAVPGTVPADRAKVVAALGEAGWQAASRDVTRAGYGGGGGAGVAAVDFDDDDADDGSAAAAADGMRSDADMDALDASDYALSLPPAAEAAKDGPAAEAAYLKRLTSTWSAWHYDLTWGSSGGGSGSGGGGGGGGSSTSRPSSFSREPEVAAFEQHIAKLRADLRDPNCTRSFDDMERELKETQDELWKLRGGWGGRLRSALGRS